MNENLGGRRLTPVGKRKRRMLLVFPFLVIPFLTLGFWALGGGNDKGRNSATKDAGLNPLLPGGKMKNETLDKLGFYEKADKDSLKRLEEMQNDPFYSDHASIEKGNELEQVFRQTSGNHHQYLQGDAGSSDPGAAEQKLMQKLAELNRAVSQPATRKDVPLQKEPWHDELDGFTSRVDGMNRQRENDTELQALNSMMDKIIRIQHPQETLQNPLMKNTFFNTVARKAVGDTVNNGFYSLSNETQSESSNAIEAIVDEDQTLVDGAVIKLRLKSDMYIKDDKIPAGTFLFGMTSLNGERLGIEINSIRYFNNIYPVKLKVFDLDGMEGIYVPGAITRDVLKQSAGNALQNMQLASLDPSLAAQATAAGITTVKNLLGKKAKLIKLTVKAGYKLLLKNQNL